MSGGELEKREQHIGEYKTFRRQQLDDSALIHGGLDHIRENRTEVIVYSNAHIQGSGLRLPSLPVPGNNCNGTSPVPKKTRKRKLPDENGENKPSRSWDRPLIPNADRNDFGTIRAPITENELQAIRPDYGVNLPRAAPFVNSQGEGITGPRRMPITFLELSHLNVMREQANDPTRRPFYPSDEVMAGHGWDQAAAARDAELTRHLAIIQAAVRDGIYDIDEPMSGSGKSTVNAILKIRGETLSASMSQRRRPNRERQTERSRHHLEAIMAQSPETMQQDAPFDTTPPPTLPPHTGDPRQPQQNEDFWTYDFQSDFDRQDMLSTTARQNTDFWGPISPPAMPESFFSPDTAGQLQSGDGQYSSSYRAEAPSQALVPPGAWVYSNEFNRPVFVPTDPSFYPSGNPHVAPSPPGLGSSYDSTPFSELIDYANAETAQRAQRRFDELIAGFERQGEKRRRQDRLEEDRHAAKGKK